MQLIAIGFFKKMVVADSLAAAVNNAFGPMGSTGSFLFWWLAVAMFAVQIYCDFSGYSDIARGLANWMGYSFPVNFNHPYRAVGLKDFWSRWHMSLSTWFRDYVYIPLGGTRAGAKRAHFNMWVTMVASGIWHGAAWTFVAWGGLHALLLSIERVTRWPDRLSTSRLGRFAAGAVTFLLVLLTWAFFRAESFSQGCDIVSAMLSPWNLRIEEIHAFKLRAILIMALFLMVEWSTNFSPSLSAALERLRRRSEVTYPLRLFLCG